MNAFVDDIIVIADSESECAQHLNTVLSVCSELGLPVSSEKVQRPSQVQTYLGIEIDSVACEVAAALYGAADRLRFSAALAAESVRWLGGLLWLR